MPIQLDKILGDIAEEKALHPNYTDATKKETDDAWSRVGKKNKLSVHEARSIFKVLQKKYEQEKMKESSSWKLFAIMEEIHMKMEDIKQDEDDLANMDEEEFIEMLEVHEEEDGDGENDVAKNNELSVFIERDRKPIKVLNSSGVPADTKLLINNQTGQKTSSAALAIKNTTSSFTNALQKKGIIMKKTTTTGGAPSTPTTSAAKISVSQSLQNALTSANKLPSRPLSRSSMNSGLDVSNGSKPKEMKRKLSMDLGTVSPVVKKQASTLSTVSPQGSLTSYPLVEVKQEPEEITATTNTTTGNISSTQSKINVITIPGNPSTADLSNGGIGITTSSTNGFLPRIEDIDFKNDIIFDHGPTTHAIGQPTKSSGAEIINLGNFDNHLPPTFFKNLCLSNRHESLGLYVANVMNRLPSRAAAKLEYSILRAIIDAKSEEMEQ